MVLMIAKNNSSYSGYNEVNRVEKSGDKSEKIWKLVSARAVVLILCFIILYYVTKWVQFNSSKQI